MRIAICIIYVHDDVDVSVNGYVDDNEYVYRYLYMHEPQNEN